MRADRGKRMDRVKECGRMNKTRIVSRESEKRYQKRAKGRAIEALKIGKKHI